MDYLELDYLGEMYIHFFRSVCNCNDASKWGYNRQQFVENELKILMKYISDKILCENLLNDDIHPMGNFEDKLYLFDCSAGIPFIFKDDRLFLNTEHMYSSEHDITDACYLKKKLVNQAQDIKFAFTTSCTGGAIDFMGNNSENLFDTPIPEFIVNSSDDLNKVTSDIESTLQKSKIFTKLWYRGQRTEYFCTRNEETIAFLKFDKSYVKMPSLVPSIGRTPNSDKKDFVNRIFRQIRWMEAFVLWVVSKNTYYKRHFPVEYNEILGLANDMSKMPKYCGMSRFNENIPYEIEEILTGNDLIYEAGVLVMQQYGELTTKLDITDDIDVALFFTQSRLNVDTMKFELTEPTDERVIYVLSGFRNTSTINIYNDIFSIPVTWECGMPLRILNQKCGLLSGADCNHKNTYAYRIIAKIKFSNSNIHTTKSVEELFPNECQDDMYNLLMQVKPSLEGLYG